jgi:hypothetical protein
LLVDQYSQPGAGVRRAAALSTNVPNAPGSNVSISMNAHQNNSATSPAIYQLYFLHLLYSPMDMPLMMDSIDNPPG